MRIKEVAEEFGLLPTTLRFYEEKGLTPPVPRDAHGVRDYGEYERGWVKFIKCMRGAGCSIAMLQNTAASAARATRPCPSASRF